MGSKYRPLVPNKTNSYLCSDHGVSQATSKRVRLFSPEPEEDCSRAAVAEVEQSPNAAITISDLAIAMECQTLKERNAILVRERDQAIGEMEDAIRGKADALKERDVAIDQMERAITACDAAKAGRYKAGVERDAALHKSDQAAKAMALLNARITALEAELEESVKKNDLTETINRALEQDKNDSSQLIAALAENVSRLQTRVSALETQSSRSSNVTINYGNSMRYITLFTTKLFPELVQKERENELFNVLYANKKSFHKHVNTVMKEKLLPELKVGICKEIKKYYAAWKFLAVMDGSNQSLNQVRSRYRSYLFYYCIVFVILS